MSNKKRLGKGIGALISEEEVKPENSEVVTEKLEVKTAKVGDAMKEANENPRISLWSFKSAAVLKYLRKTIPEFSMSDEASKLLEEAIKDKYPQIWEEMEKQLKK